jgi:large subunit ribosomal protein L23
MNKYAFEVNPLSNKTEVRKAVEKMFGVKVLSCNMVTRKGKYKRTRTNAGFKSDTKKAVVTLAKDAKIDFFEGF